MIDIKKLLVEQDYPVVKLGKKLWPDSCRRTQQVNASNLVTGKTKTLKPEWVEIICVELGITYNEFFNGKSE